VMISPERPARDIHQIVEAIVEQLTTLPGSQVKLRLEIEAEVPDGLERAKVRTLVENANTLGFIEKSVEGEATGMLWEVARECRSLRRASFRCNDLMMR